MLSASRIIVKCERPRALNTGVLLFLPYRAMEARVFAGLAERGSTI
jgi:hypothetical protein